MFYKVPKDDWQYLVPFLLCVVSYAASDFLQAFEKTDFAYWSGGLLAQPYRAVTTHFIHVDAKHLLANSSGIVVARFCLKGLLLRENYFFLLLVALLIPLQTFIFWFVDIFLLRNPISLAVGFSGILFGVNAFLLLASIYGKPRFIGFNIDLKKNQQIRQVMVVLTVISGLWSVLPGVSLLGHFSGFIAGSLLFLL